MSACVPETQLQACLHIYLFFYHIEYVYMYICIYIYICIYVYIQVYTHTHIHTFDMDAVELYVKFQIWRFVIGILVLIIIGIFAFISWKFSGGKIYLVRGAEKSITIDGMYNMVRVARLFRRGSITILDRKNLTAHPNLDAMASTQKPFVSYVSADNTTYFMTNQNISVGNVLAWLKTVESY